MGNIIKRRIIHLYPLFVLLLLGLLVPVQAPVEAHAQTSEVEYWAVIVGVADYENFGPAPSYLLPLPWETYDLEYSDDDAQEFAADLSSYWAQDHVKLLVNSEATKANIEDAICNWLDPKEDANDVVLFFFSGHGGDGYLLPYESSKYSYAYDITDSELNGWLSYLDSNNMVIVLDTCDAAGFFGELEQSGRLILAACDDGEDSWEYRSLGDGVFAYYLLDAFDNLEPVDTNDNRKISAEELFYYLEPKVAVYGDKDQHPQLYDGYAGELNLFSYTPPTPSFLSWIIMIVGGAGAIGIAAVVLRRRRRTHIYPIRLLPKVNINTATASELETLPGIGPVKAQNIIDYRNKHGPFLWKEDLLYVESIGEATYEALEDMITI